MQTNNKIQVSIVCAVYNQEPFLRDCLDGFVAQNTNFPFEIVVHDDASLDNSLSIIREYADQYPQLFKVIVEEENVYKKKGLLGINNILLSAASGKYIAECWGDDYWIDSNKLQKQYDYLETHPQCGLCRTNENHLISDTGEIIEGFFSIGSYRKIQNTFEDFLYHGWYAGPSTWMYRKELMTFPPLDPKTHLMDDICMLLEISSKSEVHYLDVITTVYRVSSGSVSHQKSVQAAINFSNLVNNVQVYYARRKSVFFRMKFWVHLSFYRWKCFRKNITYYPYLMGGSIKNLIKLFSLSS